MRPLIVLSARAAGMAILVVLGLGIAGGLVRLLPWVVAPDVPLRLTEPFARLLATTALEASVLVGLPTGVAVGAALLVERGEARSLAALGSSPARLVAPVAALAGLFVALYAGLSATADPEPPGRLSALLVGRGRESCSEGAGRVEVPLVGVTWLCFPGGPRLAGRVPGIPGEAWFSARAVAPADDLRRIDLDELHVAARIGARTVALRAARATIGGLPGWGGPRGVTGTLRSILVGASAWFLAIWSAWLVLGRPRATPIGTAVVSVLAAAAMLAVLRSVDARGGGGGMGYGLVPLTGAVCAALGLLGIARFQEPRIARSGPG